MPITITPGVSIGSGVYMGIPAAAPAPPATTGSVQFNAASSQYLTVNGSGSFNASVNKWTIEGWAYYTGGWGIPLFTFRDNTAGDSTPAGDLLYASWQSNGTFTVGSTPDGINPINTSLTLTPSTWYHIVLNCKSSGVTGFYVNGVCRGSFNNNVFTSKAATKVFIGGRPSTGYLTGLVSNFRLVTGLANGVYNYGTTNGTTYFTPPTSPLTAVTGTQILLNTVSGANFLVDSSTNAYSVSNNGGATSSASNPF